MLSAKPDWIEHVTNFAHIYTVLHDLVIQGACQRGISWRSGAKSSLFALILTICTSRLDRRSWNRGNWEALRFRLRDLAVPLSKIAVQNLGRHVHYSAHRLFSVLSLSLCVSVVKQADTHINHRDAETQRYTERISDRTSGWDHVDALLSLPTSRLLWISKPNFP